MPRQILECIKLHWICVKHWCFFFTTDEENFLNYILGVVDFSCFPLFFLEAATSQFENAVEFWRSNFKYVSKRSMTKIEIHYRGNTAGRKEDCFISRNNLGKASRTLSPTRCASGRNEFFEITRRAKRDPPGSWSRCVSRKFTLGTVRNC